MAVFIGADHNGFSLKEALKRYFQNSGVAFVDMGNAQLDPDDDYPDFALEVAKKVIQENGKGILICGSGGGVCIVANKVRGIRAAEAFDANDAKKLREHNDINVLCLSGWRLTILQAQAIVKAFIETEFTGEPRHERRLEKIVRIENNPETL